jgi:hypothetical protein
MTAAGLCLGLLVPLSSTAQQKPFAGLHQRFQASVQRFADSTLRVERSYWDSVSTVLALTASRASSGLEVWTDSLIRSASDSLDAPRKDTLRSVARNLQSTVTASAESAKRIAGGHFDRFLGEMTRVKRTYAACDNCEEPSDFKERFDQFREIVDGVRESLRDTASVLLDDHRDAFQDRYETARDSLNDLRDQLIERRVGEIDFQRYEATRVTVSTVYSSHAAYRGRDNGVKQQMIAPAVEFHHSSGFSIQVSTSWVDQTSQSWNGATASAGYEFMLGSVFGGGVSYSHFWFSDSSRSEEAVFKDAFDASFSVSLPFVYFSLQGDLATGTASEFTLTASMSHTFEIPLSLYNNITIEPAVAALLGGQNSTLTTLRTVGAKGQKVVGVSKQSRTTFSILDYQLSLPVTLNFGPVSIAPALIYTMPANVVDLSTSTSFLDFDLGVRVSFR